jgi:RNA polymerase sigma-70 factor, ECF subfamily
MFADTLTKKIQLVEQGNRVAARSMTGDELDSELVQRMAAGDDTALRELYAAYGQRLYAYALRLTDDPAQAEDVLQDTLLVVWRTAGRFRGDGRVIAWLLGILHHTAIKSLRRRSQPISDVMEETIPTPGLSLEEAVQADEQAQVVRRGLQSLSPEQRAVLELAFYQKLSLKEVAEVCGCPVGTVKSRLSYARQQLRRILSRMDQDTEVRR